MDKPPGLSSFAVVRRIRHVGKISKVGHTGTLDPAATGLLLLLTGKATRQQQIFMQQDKQYAAVIRLGVETDTWDLDGRILAEKPVPEISSEAIHELLHEFLGEQEQIPPPYSALKVAGVPAYRLARRGQPPSLAARRVQLHAVELASWVPPDLYLTLTCSSGYYVRALAHDLGRRLDCGASLKALRRTRIGDVSIDDAWTLQELEPLIKGHERNPKCPI